MPNTPQQYSDVVTIFNGIIDLLIPLLVTLALVLFFWGIAKFIWNGGNEESVKTGKQLMFWGIIILFIMLSFLGILQLFHGDIFGGSFNFPPSLPQ